MAEPPIRFVVPYPPGGSTDIAARVIGEYLSRTLGQQIVVENKTGASGNDRRRGRQPRARPMATRC